jgi:dihydrodipicolinate synthase/N-acetylneuraminate lyase
VRAGADGFVPGAGNFAPALAREVITAICSGDPAAAEAAQQRIDAVNATYQKGRTISQLFAALKAILELQGLASRHVFPPLLPATDEEIAVLRTQLCALGLLS